MATDLAGDVITRKRGDTAPDALTVVDSAGAPRDLTGFSFKLTVNSTRNPTDATAQLAQLTGIIDADPTTGRVLFPWSALAADQVPGKYWYDIQQTDASGFILTIAKNKYVFQQDITKS